MCESTPDDYICIPREEDIALQRVAKAAERFPMDVLEDQIEEMPDDTPGPAGPLIQAVKAWRRVGR